MDPDQTARMRRLIWIHAGRKRTMSVLPWRGSYITFEDIRPHLNNHYFSWFLLFFSYYTLIICDYTFCNYHFSLYSLLLINHTFCLIIHVYNIFSIKNTKVTLVAILHNISLLCLLNLPHYSTFFPYLYTIMPHYSFLRLFIL